MNSEECVAVLERLAKITYWTNNEKRAIEHAIQALTQTSMTTDHELFIKPTGEL